MELFVSNAAVSELEERLVGGPPPPRLEVLVALAWHLRQRDSARAWALADEALALLASAASPAPQMRARLVLARAEVLLLRADTAGAQHLADQAQQAFADLHDAQGQGDVHWLCASIAVDLGQREQVDAHMEAALSAFQQAADSQRVALCEARRLVYLAFRDPAATELRRRAVFGAEHALSEPVRALLAAARGAIAALTDDVAAAVGFYLQSYHAALDCGQVRQGLVSACNAGESMAVLGDIDAALQLGEQALARARTCGWPSTLGLCLYRVGDVLRLLGRHDEAQTYLEEALERMQGSVGSRNYEQVLTGLGQLALDKGEAAVALDWFGALERMSQQKGEPDASVIAWRGQASALMLLGQADEARLKARQAHDLARHSGNGEGQIRALQVLAQIHGSMTTSATPDPHAPAQALECLQQALAVAATVSGYRLSPELLGDVAAAYAALDDYRNAYAFRMQADHARLALYGQEVQRRAQAMQIRQEVEQARAATEHHRQLAAAAAQTTATLETLVLIGREITANLKAQAVFEALHRHVHGLLDTTAMAIYLMDASGQQLSAAFCLEAGQSVQGRSIRLDSTTSYVARCVRERRELMLDLADAAHTGHLVPGTLNTQSLLYGPLLVGERLCGAMTIQSIKAHAYGARERSIFRVLCAYGAIALDNAAAYAAAEAAQQQADAALHQLRQTQAQLLEQNQQLAQLAITDRLTQLYNRLRLDQVLEAERVRCARYASVFSVILLDVDHFKAVNDQYGHEVGDQVLVELAQVLRSSTREADVVGRWGGEEFLVICCHARAGAAQLAHKLQHAVAQHPFTRVGQRSASFGVAEHRAGATVSDTLARADGALYQAKQAGRNCVVVAPDV